MSARGSTGRRVAAVVLTLTSVSACTTAGSGSATPSPSAAAGAGGSPTTSSPTPAAPPPRPRTGACYRLGASQLAAAGNASRPVPCRRPHDALTVFVGRQRAGGPQAIEHQLATTCGRRLARYVGGSLDGRRRSRINVVWFSPTAAQAQAGAAWFRCDLIVFRTGARLLSLPRASRLHRALDRPSGSHTFGLCGTAAPGAPGFERVVCSVRHSWKAVATIPLAGGRHYPGTATVRDAGTGVCQGKVRAAQGFSLRFSYGWEWPTRAQWTAGQHYGYCWAPV